MIKNKKTVLCEIALLIFTFVICAFSYANANELLAVNNTKPVLRSTPASNAIQLRGATNITKTNPKITLSLKDSDVQPVLRMFADKAGLNIIFHQSATGSVTLDLVNVPLNDAFRMVLQVTGLTYHMDGKTLVISSLDHAKESGWSKQEMYTVPVHYVDAALIANFLNQNIFSKNTPGLSNWNVVATNATKNELLVFGTQNDLSVVKKIAAKFDVPPLVTTFTVKHTTPAEMAKLVCNMLKITEGSTDIDIDSDSSGGSAGTINRGNTQTQQRGNRGVRTGLAANIPQDSSYLQKIFGKNGGTITGFAAESGDSGGGDSGSGSSIAIGKNVVACTIDKDGVTEGDSESESGEEESSSSSGSSNKMKSFGNIKMIVSYFPQRGTINVLGGSQNQINNIKEFIQKNDVKQPQAYLDISIVEISEAGEKDLTNIWNIYSKNFNVKFDGSGGGTGTMSPIIFGPDNQYYSKVSVSPQVQWFVNYIVTNQKGRVVANPKIILTNGETSVINLTDDYVQKVDAQIVTTGTVSFGTGVEREYQIGNDMGLQFSLTPFISPEGYISLDFQTQYATQGEQITAQLVEAGDPELVATLLNRRTVNLKNVRIKDGETLIIGGLMRDNESKNVAKVPFLGDIPVIGLFFRSTTTRKDKTEMLIMLTPKILKDAEDIGEKLDNNNNNAL